MNSIGPDPTSLQLDLKPNDALRQQALCRNDWRSQCGASL